MNSKLMLKVTVVALVLPGTVTILIPYCILLQSRISDWPAVTGRTVLASLAAISAVATLVHCIREFAIHGKGTLAPVNPPQRLVVHGLYRYTRNPMYLAVVISILSEALFFDRLSLLVYAAAVFFGFHCFVIFYEEPHLRSEFGESYIAYLKSVPRWWIRTKPFTIEKRPEEP